MAKQTNEISNKIGGVVDDLGESIAMLKYMTTSVLSTMNGNINDQESYGLQLIFFHIENTFEKSFDCLNEDILPSLNKEQQDGTIPKAAGKRR